MNCFRLSWGARGELAAGLLLPLVASACIPYTAGTTAQPLRPGQTSTSLSTFVMPSVGRLDPNRSYSFLAADLEVRRGIDERSDVGIRIPSGVGVVVNYKRLISDSSSRMRVAVIPGAGFVNMGNHAEFEFTLIASGYEPVSSPGAGARDARSMTFVPYGGLKVIQVAPLAEGQAHDLPTAGGFLGVRVGSVDFGISPEIGVFYDHSTLGVRRGDLVIVPAITVHGDELIGMLRGRPRRQADAPPVFAPPVYAPPVYAPPVYAPPVYAPPVYAPPANARPAQQSRPQERRCAGPRRQPCRPATATPTPRGNPSPSVRRPTSG